MSNMSTMFMHNNTVALNDMWWESHATLIRNVCMELGHSDKGNSLVEKFLPPKMKIKVQKDPTKPKRAKSAYFFFCEEKRPALIAKQKKKNGSVVIGDIAKELGVMWKKLKDKSKYNKLNEKDKERYTNEIADYNEKWNL